MARKAAKCIGLVLIGAAAFAALRHWLQREGAGGPAAEEHPDIPVSPPTLTSVPDLEPVPVRTVEPESPAPEGGGQTWLLPVDGACPPGHPVKAKVSSGIFHVPGGLSYERTKPDRCYPSEAAAEADGFRRAKR